MSPKAQYDSVVVGSGPNGLAAAITLARAGLSVLVLEACEAIGGGTRTAELTLPGFLHDVCSAIHPLGLASPFFHDLPLSEHGLEWVHSPASAAHPLEGGRAVTLEISLEDTARQLGQDAAAYQRLIAPLAEELNLLAGDMLGPLPLPPRHPFKLASFGLKAIRSGVGLAKGYFAGEEARALFAGMAAHSILPLEQAITASFGLVMLMMGHNRGWPLARGGSQRISAALASYLQSLGGEIVTGRRVTSLDELPASRVVLLDIAPRQVVALAGDRLPGGYRRALERYRYGPAVCKVDYALDAPIPWQNPACSRAATVHIGGSLEEITAGERAVWRGEHPERPFIILAQQSLFDATRAPAGKHTAWAYCHVPNRSSVDMTAAIDAQIERFAPGFRERILKRHTRLGADWESYNPNYVGGDINAGVQDLWQFYTRPAMRLTPYRTPVKGLYLCSSSTPPGGGVHGMCGYHAARTVLKDLKIVYTNG
jgi:phytoene dehydrogenase-like protein